MTKNLLNKIRSSLESSSKKVHDQKFSVELQDGSELLEFEQVNNNNDRSQLYRVVASNYENHKMLKKIPVLVSENKDLKDKVEKLEFCISELRGANRRNKTFSSMENSFCPPEQHQKRDYIRIQHQNDVRERACSNKEGSLSLLRERIKSSRNPEAQGQENFGYSPLDRRKRNFAKLSSQIIKYFQTQIEELKLQNQRLNQKYQRMSKSKKLHSEDIDRIKKNFEETLQKQEQMFKKQHSLSEQRIKAMETQICQLQGQNQAIKMQNWVLTQKLAESQIAFSIQKQNTDSLGRLPQKQNTDSLGRLPQKQNTDSLGRLRQKQNYRPVEGFYRELQQQEHQRGSSASRVRFNCQKG